MATFWRDGHWRGSSWVEGHWVTRNDFSKTSYGYSELQNYSYTLETHESFTIPNVRCKCCGDEIFFYQSPYGGKVFFNELGHPWEKHCCEPECCAKKIENITYEILNKDRIIESSKEPFWKKDGWTPAIYIKEEYYETSLLTKITLKAMNNYQEHSFIVQNKQFSLFEMREGLAINFRPIDETFFEISFYLDDRDRKYIVIASISLNFNDLEEFIVISDSLALVKRNNLTNIKLAEVFFKILNISDKYQNKKQEIYNLILNNNNSIKSGMWRVYTYIYKHGIAEFEKDLLTQFESYNKISIHILLLLISMRKTLLLNKVQKIILNKWKQKGWEVYFYKEDKHCDTFINEIVLKSAEDNQEYSYYIQKRYFHSKIKEKFPIFLRSLNEKFFEIFLYDDANPKIDKIILAKYPSHYELSIFTFIKTSLEFIKQENIKNIQLVKLFFKILNISDDYKEEKIQLNNFIVNHKISKETGMLDIYVYVNKFGIEKFEKRLLNKFEFYDDEIINILASLNTIPALYNISAIIFKYKNKKIEKLTSDIKPLLNSKQKNIFKKKKDKTNL
ncbi:MAG TPA: hypothetical protein EYG73_11860, partial [Arcobacter sp.]|nr:hypothetical protein [Arcobacter sp.]